MKGHDVYVQDKELFGNDDWIQMRPPTKYSLFPYFGHTFVENLVLNKEKNAVELIKPSDIDSIYHSDIVDAQFFLSSGYLNETVIRSEEKKKGLIGKAETYSFAKVEEIAFKISKEKRIVNIYVEPQHADFIYLLKQIKNF